MGKRRATRDKIFMFYLVRNCKFLRTSLGDPDQRIFETKYINPQPPKRNIPKDAVTSVLLRTGASIPLHILASASSGFKTVCPSAGQRGSYGHLGSVHLGLWGLRDRLQCGSGANRTHLR